MKHQMIGARILAALLPLICAAGFALPASADLPAALVNASQITEKAGSYHVTVITGTGAQATTSEGDMQSTNPLKMRMTSTTPEGPMQMIVIAPDSYMKIGSAAWKKFPGSPDEWSQMSVKKLIDKNRKDYVVTDLGMLSRGGQSYHAYKIVNLAKNSTQTVFLDTAGRFARLEIGTTVMTFSKFGEPVSIVPPM